MAKMPASGALTFSNMSTVHGGATPDRLSEYYRNGPLVNDHPDNSGIPTSGLIRLGQFYGSTDAALPDEWIMTTGSGTLFEKKGPNASFRGFDGGSDWYTRGPNAGSVDQNTFVDSDGNTRTITAIYQSISGAIDSMYFGITPQSVPDTDRTFLQLTTNVGGLGSTPNTEIVWVRSAAVYSPIRDSGTHWKWPLPVNAFTWAIPSTSTVPCRLDFD